MYWGKGGGGILIIGKHFLIVWLIERFDIDLKHKSNKQHYIYSYFMFSVCALSPVLQQKQLNVTA